MHNLKNQSSENKKIQRVYDYEKVILISTIINISKKIILRKLFKNV